MSALLCLPQHPLVASFALACGITWGAILMVLASKGFDLVPPRPEDNKILNVALMLPGPCASGLVWTARLAARAGLRDLWQRLAHWRVVGAGPQSRC